MGIKKTVSADWSEQRSPGKLHDLVRFTLVGAFAGIAIGLWEAGMIYFQPSDPRLVHVDAAYVVWFIAVLVDLFIFALAGAALGTFSALAGIKKPERFAVLDAVLVGLAGAFAAAVPHFLHRHPGDFDPFKSVNVLFLFAVARYALIFFLAAILAHAARQRFGADINFPRFRPLRSAAIALAIVIAVLCSGLLYYSARRWSPSAQLLASPASPASHPNIVLISIDTLRADHVSAYGYARPTTPNIDRLASRGVLFENAVAPCSWTLPALASILTGTLPHQNGSGASRALPAAVATLAEALTGHGYEAAGFNANHNYGLKGWGLGQGFQPYADASTTLSYNLARTLVGRLAAQPLYQRFGHYQVFYRESAQDVNQEIITWFRRRSPRPYFTFINYMDVHSPYLAPQPFTRRFGELPEKLVPLSERILTHSSESVTPRQRASLIAGYDNSLAYADDQIGRLIRFLSGEPGWENTVVIITADHGEAFEEHGDYGHGRHVFREEIHVPLIFLGRGIPAGVRIEPAVSTRSLFSTVLGFALGKNSPLPQYSLARFWNPSSGAEQESAGAITELDELNLRPVSLTTAGWHYIHFINGQQRLYNWKDDPEERHNLSALSQYRDTTNEMHARLNQLARQSIGPWFGPDYLFGLNEPDHDFVAENSPPENPALKDLRSAPRRIGAMQAFFMDPEARSASRLPTSQQELLKTLPYQ